MLPMLKLHLQDNVKVSTDQKITVEVMNEPVSVLLNQIGKQLDKDFSYNTKVVDNKKKITVYLKNKGLSEIISTVFKDTLTYNIKGNYIILHARKKNSNHVSTLRKALAEPYIKKPDTPKKNSFENKNTDSIPALESSPVNVIPTPSRLSDTSSKATDDTVDNKNLIPKLFLFNNDSVILLEETDTIP